MAFNLKNYKTMNNPIKTNRNPINKEVIAMQTAKIHYSSLAKQQDALRPRTDASDTIHNLYFAPLAKRVVDRESLDEVVQMSENPEKLALDVAKTYELMDLFLNRNYSEFSAENIKSLKNFFAIGFLRPDFLMFEALLDHVIANQNTAQCKKLVKIAKDCSSELGFDNPNSKHSLKFPELRNIFEEIKKYEPAKPSTFTLTTNKIIFLFILFIAGLYGFVA